MSEKLSELSKYVCDQCGTEECLSPTRKTLSKEGKNNEGDLIILDFDIYHCCRDNNESSYCDYCENISKKKDVPITIDEVIEESNIIAKVVDEVKALPKKVKTELQLKKEALLAQLKQLDNTDENPPE